LKINHVFRKTDEKTVQILKKVVFLSLLSTGEQLNIRSFRFTKKKAYDKIFYIKENPQ
jgi:hypothetical protein